MSYKASDIEVVILCGGLGTRLQQLLPDTPKSLAKIRNKPFLDLLLEDLYAQGFRNFIFCVGHLKNQIIEYYKNSVYSIKYSEEVEPLGTGGALKAAQHLIKSDPFIVMNGDSICRVNYQDLLDFHALKQADISIVIAQTKDRNDAGNVSIDKKQMIISFAEKTNSKTQFISGGIYVFSRNVINTLPQADKFSLEFDVFPDLENNNSFGFISESDVIDIGTVERYTKAVKIL